jgi:phosphoglycolate phosphatase-like HAD superfamily hydrolase
MDTQIGLETLQDQNIESVVSDYSGVMQDDRDPFYEANMMILDHYDKPRMTKDEWLTKTQISAAKFAQSQGIDVEDDVLNNMNKKFYEEVVRSGKRPVLYPDVKETLEFLRREGINMSILSTHPQENLMSEVKEYEILGYFTLVVGSSKDKTKDLKEICEKVGDNVLYVDDSMWGVIAGKRANVLTAGITTGYHPRSMLEQAKPDYILEAFSDLKLII